MNTPNHNENAIHEPDIERLEEERRRLEDFKKIEQPLSSSSQTKMFKAVSLYGVAIDFALAIIIPLVALLFLGQWVAKKTGAEWVIIVFLFLAITVSSFSIYKQIINLKKKMNP